MYSSGFRCCFVIALIGGLLSLTGSLVRLTTVAAANEALEVTDEALQESGEQVPAEVQGVGLEQKLGDRLPLDVEVVDSQGRKIRLQELFTGERPVLVTLNYSDCPMLCSVQLNQLVQGLDELELKIGADFHLLTLSIDPKELPQRALETKKKYLGMLTNQPGARDGWTFATSTKKEIDRVCEALGFRYRYDTVSKEYYHPAMLAFLSPQGVITRYSLEVAFPPDQLRLAIVEASSGTVGTLVDQFVMLCFTYDPDRNRYVASAWKIMRLGGIVTIVAILAVVAPFWFGAKRHSIATKI